MTPRASPTAATPAEALSLFPHDVPTPDRSNGRSGLAFLARDLADRSVCAVVSLVNPREQTRLRRLFQAIGFGVQPSGARVPPSASAQYLAHRVAFTGTRRLRSAVKRVRTLQIPGRRNAFDGNRFPSLEPL